MRRIPLITWSVTVFALLAVGLTIAVAPPSALATPPIDGGTTIAFGPGTDVTTAADGARAVHAADLDDDGDMDLLSAAVNDNTITWYESDGANPPSFTATDVITTASAAFSVYAADLDSDGDMDILSASVGDNTIAWYENDGAADPTFTTRVITTAANGARSVYAADLDSDGDMDVLSASINDDKIAWYENDGAADPSFTARTITTSANGATSVFVADLDNDGDLDVLSASLFDNKIAWYENDGAADPSFTTRVIDDTVQFPGAVYAADLDNDGDMDVLAASEGDSIIYWFENNGAINPTFTARTLSTTAMNPGGVFAIDLDEDGDMDVLSASAGDDKIAWYENDGADDPTFAPHTITTTADGARGVYAADLDHDGDLDVLSAATNDDTIAWYENDAVHLTASFHSGVNLVAENARDVSAADLDNDGDLDILGAVNNSITWYENDGAADPAFTARVIATPVSSARSVHAADVDNDGDLDVLSASYTSNTIAWHENDGAAEPAFTTHVITTAATGASSVYAADLDNDGDIDVLSASSFDKKIAWYENDGAADPTFTPHVITISADFANDVHAADVDNDGDVDILSASVSDATIAWYENDGAADPAFTTRTITTSASGATAVFAADLDNDGDLDVLSATYQANTIGWYENDGAADPSFTARNIATAADGAVSVYAADLDNDGDLDVLSASTLDDTIAWYENDGAAEPAFSARVITTSADGAQSVIAADLDNDGDLEALSASIFADTITWYENEGGSAGLAVSDTAITSGFIPDGSEDDLLQVIFTHNGRSGDRDLAFSEWYLDLLAGDCATPLTSDAANKQIAALNVRLDDGDGIFETDGSDVAVAATTSFSLDSSGAQQISFNSDDANVQVSAGSSKTYWVSLEAPVDQGQLLICLNFDPDADALVRGKSPDTSVTVQDSVPTNTGSTPLGKPFSFIYLPAAPNGPE